MLFDEQDALMKNGRRNAALNLRPVGQKCIDEGITKLKTFMRQEYEYLLDKGYVLQENGLMIKP